MREDIVFDPVAMLNAPRGATSYQDDKLAKSREFLARVRQERAEKGGPLGERRINEIFAEHFSSAAMFLRNGLNR